MSVLTRRKELRIVIFDLRFLSHDLKSPFEGQIANHKSLVTNPIYFLQRQNVDFSVLNQSFALLKIRTGFQSGEF